MPATLSLSGNIQSSIALTIGYNVGPQISKFSLKFRMGILLTVLALLGFRFLMGILLTVLALLGFRFLMGILLTVLALL